MLKKKKNGERTNAYVTVKKGYCKVGIGCDPSCLCTSLRHD